MSERLFGRLSALGRLRKFLLGMLALLSSASFSLSQNFVSERFMRAQTDLRRHRSQMLQNFGLPNQASPKIIFSVEHGSRIFLRWSKRPSQKLKALSVKLVSIDGVEAQQDLRIPEGEQWALKWYSVWLPYQSKDVSILYVEAEVEKLDSLNPFASSKKTVFYNAKLPIGAVDRKNSKKILMTLQNKTPWSQSSSAEPDLVLTSIEDNKVGVR